MKRIFNSNNFPKDARNPIVALGNFDGVHLGHRRLIEETKQRAKDCNGISVVYTFSPHPVKILAPEQSPLLIQTLNQRLSSLEEMGIEISVVEKFTTDFASQTAEVFFNHILVERLHPKAIVAGYDFTFGQQRHGTMDMLKKFGAAHQIELINIEPQFLGDTLISSTNIRRLIEHGDVKFASALLARNYTIEGTVVKGRGIGKSLGAHTANLKSDNELIPGSGVYLTNTRIEDTMTPGAPLKTRFRARHSRVPLSPIKDVRGRIQSKSGSPMTSLGDDVVKEGFLEVPRYPSITSIGNNPTFPNCEFTVENHILDFEANLTGKKISIEFIQKMRNQITFPSAGELSKQIHNDIESAHRLHNLYDNN